jgi:hypothetical protein
MIFGNRFSHSIVAESFDLDVTMNTNNLAVIDVRRLAYALHLH